MSKVKKHLDLNIWTTLDKRIKQNYTTTTSEACFLFQTLKHFNYNNLCILPDEKFKPTVRKPEMNTFFKHDAQRSSAGGLISMFM